MDSSAGISKKPATNGEAVQGFHTGWGLSGIGGEDGAYGFDGYLRKQTTYLNWA